MLCERHVSVDYLRCFPYCCSKRRFLIDSLADLCLLGAFVISHIYLYSDSDIRVKSLILHYKFADSQLKSSLSYMFHTPNFILVALTPFNQSFKPYKLMIYILLPRSVSHSYRNPALSRMDLLQKLRKLVYRYTKAFLLHYCCD